MITSVKKLEKVNVQGSSFRFSRQVRAFTMIKLLRTLLNACDNYHQREVAWHFEKQTRLAVPG